MCPVLSENGIVLCACSLLLSFLLLQSFPQGREGKAFGWVTSYRAPLFGFQWSERAELCCAPCVVGLYPPGCTQIKDWACNVPAVVQADGHRAVPAARSPRQHVKSTKVQQMDMGSWGWGAGMNLRCCAHLEKQNTVC